MPVILNLNNYRFLPLLIILLLSGCSKEWDLPEDKTVKGNEATIPEPRTTEDPYAIHNILKAYKKLLAADSSLPSILIKPNHVYLRFLPGNASEKELLAGDTSLVLYDYPLNSGMGEGEPGVTSLSGENQLSWQYCVVPVGKELPTVYHEVIYEVFIPGDDEMTAKSASKDLTGFYEELVNESARITGNLPADDTIISQTARSSRGRWNPKGRVRVWDDLLKMYIPLNHVNVRARWFTHVETDLTDEEGWFEMKPFRYAVNYSIKWENSCFTIRDGLFVPAWFNGPKKKGDWMPDISEGKSKMYATIHRAAYKLFYGDNLGLMRPVLKTGGRTKICYMEGEGTGKFLGDFSAGGILPDIQVWGNKNQRSTNFIFGTVSHELGHQLHSQLVGNIRFVQLTNLIRESWAEAVEWAETNDEYHKLGVKYNIAAARNYDHQYNKHVGWPLVYDKDYSPIFIDLVDAVNQREEEGPDHPNDLISQYSISYIGNNILLNSDNIGSLRREVTRHKMEGVDDYKIGELFYLYE